MITFANRGATRADFGEARLARLTDVAYQVALQHGLKGSFLEFQLDLWKALREELVRQQSAAVADGARPASVPLSEGSLYFAPAKGRAHLAKEETSQWHG